MRWRLAARMTGVGIALITASAGVLLIEPRLLAIGIEIPRCYALLGAFLVVTAALSIVAALRGGPALQILWVDFALLRVPLYVLAASALLMAGAAIWIERYAFALLIIPALGALATLQRDRLPPHAAVGPEEVGLTPAAGRALTSREIWRQVFGVAFAMGSFALAFWSVPVGIAFSALLARQLVCVPPTFDLFFSSLAREIWYPAILAFLVLFFPFFTLIEGGIRRLRLAGVSDANRNLSLSELGAIEHAYWDTAEYADRAHYDDRMWRPALATTALNLVLLVLFAAIFFWVFLTPLPQPPLTGEVWFVGKPDLELSVGFFVGTVVAFFITGLPTCAIALFWRRYAERAGWLGLIRTEGYAGLTRRLVLLARRHRLSEPFAASLFLAREGRRISRGALAFLVLAIVATAGVFYHQAQTPVIRPSGIDLIDPWTHHSSHVAFRDVKYLELRCTSGGGRKVGIVLGLPDGRSIDLIRGKRFDSGLARIDAQLRMAGTPVRFARDGARWLYDPACVRAVAKPHAGADVLRLDEWEHRALQ